MNRGFFRLFNNTCRSSFVPTIQPKVQHSFSTMSMGHMEIQTMINKAINVPNCLPLINLRELILKSKAEELTSAAECISIQSYVADLLGVIGKITSTTRVNTLGQHLKCQTHYCRFTSRRKNHEQNNQPFTRSPSSS